MAILKNIEKYDAWNLRKQGFSKFDIFKKLNVLDLKTSEDLAYLLGVYFSDGSVNVDGFLIGVTDLEFAESVRDCLYRLFNKRKEIKQIMNRKSLIYYFSFCSVVLRDFLKLKTYDKAIIPKEILEESNDKIRWSLLTGMINGDGSITYKRNMKIYFTTKCSNCISWKDLLDSLGLRHSIYLSLTKKGLKMANFWISVSEYKKILLNCPLLIARKREPLVVYDNKLKEKERLLYEKTKPRLCACGCGDITKIGNRGKRNTYLFDHQHRKDLVICKVCNNKLKHFALGFCEKCYRKDRYIKTGK